MAFFYMYVIPNERDKFSLPFMFFMVKILSSFQNILECLTSICDNNECAFELYCYKAVKNQCESAKSVVSIF